MKRTDAERLDFLDAQGDIDVDRRTEEYFDDDDNIVIRKGDFSLFTCESQWVYGETLRDCIDQAMDTCEAIIDEDLEEDEKD